MIYLFVDKNTVKLLYLKKNIFSQYHTFFFEKIHEIDLLENGKVTKTDLLASAIKEALTSVSEKTIKEKDVFLILPQESFSFLRTEVPLDIAHTAIVPFIRDKSRAQLPVDIDACFGEYLFKEDEKQKILTFFAIENQAIQGFQKVFSLLDLKIKKIFPNTLAYFKLFEKTLRKEKKESIFYVLAEKNNLKGYLFDSFGLLSPKQWNYDLKKNVTIEEALKEKVEEMEKEKNSPNRIVLSGADSENIRQDTFTKSVGVWTNPLKRIITDFYTEYIKQIILKKDQTFPLLHFDACFGSFIFNEENKDFSFFKKNFKPRNQNKSFSLPKFKFPSVYLKYIFIFLASFFLSFLIFTVISKTNISNILPQKKTESTITPRQINKPSLTPTPSIKRSELKIKILNGSGTKGKAGEVKDILKEKGYGEILTDNADNFDYVKTEVQVKKDKKEIVKILQDDLVNYVTLKETGEIENNQLTDVIIIVGSDFK